MFLEPEGELSSCCQLDALWRHLVVGNGTVSHRHVPCFLLLLSSEMQVYRHAWTHTHTHTEVRSAAVDLKVCVCVCVTQGPHQGAEVVRGSHRGSRASGSHPAGAKGKGHTHTQTHTR